MNTFKEELATKASILYYEENNNQNKIASKLGISRSYVSQLLSYARSHNIVTIIVNVNGFYSHLIKKEIEFSRYFPEVKKFCFMKSKSPEYTKKHIGKFATSFISELIKKSNVIALDPGTSVQKIIKEFMPHSFYMAYSPRINSTDTNWRIKVVRSEYSWKSKNRNSSRLAA